MSAPDASLRATLHRWGVPLLTPAPDAAVVPIGSLLSAAVSPGTPSRLRTCVVPLLLVHGELADEVRSLEQRLGAQEAELLRCLYTAAVYLQQKWRTRLSLSIGAHPPLPDWYSRAMGLPPPDDYHGIWGLLALSDRAESHGLPSGLTSEAEDMTLLLMETLERSA